MVAILRKFKILFILKGKILNFDFEGKTQNYIAVYN